MGFGLLFVGYFFVYIISVVPFFPKIIGYALMLKAALKLSDFEVRFKRCLPIIGVLSATSLFIFAGFICEFYNISLPIFNSKVIEIVSMADEILSVLFHAVLLISVTAIAKTTELDKLSFNSMRNLLIVCAYALVKFVAMVLPNGDVRGVFTLIAFCLNVLWIILNLFLFASCYRMICEEGDEDMPDKEINIPIIKQMETVINRRNKNAFDAGVNLRNKRQSKKDKKRK